MTLIPRQGMRISAAALAALWLIVPLLSVFHGSHAHRYCAEHRAIEEAGAPEVDAEPVLAAYAPALDGQWLIAGSDEQGESPALHRACPFVVAQQRHVASPPVNGSIRVSETAGRLVVQTARMVQPQVPLLAAAPKASPPVV